jgi:hypothetical protein
VEKLIDYYGVTEPRRGQLVSMAAEGNQKEWWEAYEDIFHPVLLEIIGLESEAASIAIWETMAVPSLFQTREYAMAIMSLNPAAASVSRSMLNRRLEVHMQRQHILSRKPPTKLLVILEESVLFRAVGNGDVMRAQLSHLANAAQLPGVDLRILRSREMPPVLIGSFRLFGFSSIGGIGGLNDVLITEGLGNDVVIGGESDTHSYRLIFEALSGAALSPPRSRSLILEISKSM